MATISTSNMAVVNSTHILHRGHNLTVLSENVTLENGFKSCMDLIVHPNASAVVALADEETMLLVHQYRQPLREYIWEIPSGTARKNESPIICARRELAEETGFSARVWHPLGYIRTLPEFARGGVFLFLAMDLTAVEQRLERDELLDVHRLNLDTVQTMISDGSIQDSKTICGFFMSQQWYWQHRGE